MSSSQIFAIHTVFIARENILFMEEWLDYHLQLGFNRFYLYDNSKCVRPDVWDQHNTRLVPGSVNKHGIDYAALVPLQQAELSELQHGLADKYPDRLIFMEWSPTDADGQVSYRQLDAFADCLGRLQQQQVAWCANVDMDEFITIAGYDRVPDYLNSLAASVSNVYLPQTRFETRFKNPQQLATEITQGYRAPLNYANKYICRVANTHTMLYHEWVGTGESLPPGSSPLAFNHYVVCDHHNPPPLSTINNINPQLQARLRHNAPAYLTRLPASIPDWLASRGLKPRAAAALPPVVTAAEGTSPPQSSPPAVAATRCTPPPQAAKPVATAPPAQSNQVAAGNRILHFVPAFSAATQTFIYDLLRRLEEETPHDNIMLCRTRALREERPYDKALLLPWQRLPVATARACWQHLLQQHQTELVIVHFARYARLLHELAGPKGVQLPMLIMTHGFDVFALKNNPQDPVNQHVLTQLAPREDVWFTAPSNYLAEVLASAGVPAARIKVQPNTVYPGFFQHRKTGGFFNCSNGAGNLRLLSIGRLIPLKGHHLLLEAVAKFRRECYPAVELTIVYGNDARQLAALRAQAEQLQISDCVLFEPFVDLAADPGYLSRFDLYLHCSTYSEPPPPMAGKAAANDVTPVPIGESFGVAVLEAIAAGLRGYRDQCGWYAGCYRVPFNSFPHCTTWQCRGSVSGPGGYVCRPGNVH